MKPSGRITYSLFRVVGATPDGVDSLLSTLKDHRFRETEGIHPGDVDVGFTAGGHLFDVAFSFSKNWFEGVALCEVRIDTHRVPPPIKAAYVEMYTDEAARNNPSGFATKGQKREAAEMAERQCREELAEGKHSKQKTIPVVWDIENQTLYVGSGSNAAIEMIVRHMRTAFSVECYRMTGGPLAREHAEQLGVVEEFEDLTPAALTPAPSLLDLPESESKTPSMPWLERATDLKDFVANEFLLWLWHLCVHNEGKVADETFLANDALLNMECGWGEHGQQGLRGSCPSKLPEAVRALRAGKLPRKMGWILAIEGEQYEFVLDDQWLVTQLKLPDIEDAQSPRELMEFRIARTISFANTLNSLLEQFVTLRLSLKWNEVVESIRTLSQPPLTTS